MPKTELPLSAYSMSELFARSGEIKARRNGLVAELRSIVDKAAVEGRANLTEGETERTTRQEAAVEKLNGELGVLNTEIHARASKNPANVIEQGRAPEWHTQGSGGGSARDRAMRSIERDQFATDDHKTHAEALIERDHAKGDPRFAEYIEAVADPAYLRAFAKLLERPDLPSRLAPDEAEAVATMTKRAMSVGTDGAGGFAVPFALDPTIIPTGNGQSNPIRALAKKEQITVTKWQGIASAGVTGSWDSEAAEVSDDAPTLVQPSFDVYTGRVFVPYSMELGQDWPGLVAELGTLIRDEKDRMESVAFVSGNGTSAPQGVITALDGGASEVTPTTGEVYALADIYKTAEALPERSWNKAECSWLISRGTGFTTRQFGTGVDGADFWVDMKEGNGSTLIGKPVAYTDAMDSAGDIDAAATADNHVLLAGDWSKYRVIDRVGLTVELIPHLFATGNNRPSGQRGIFAYFRVGGGVVDINGFRVLNVATAA